MANPFDATVAPKVYPNGDIRGVFGIGGGVNATTYLAQEQQKNISLRQAAMEKVKSLNAAGLTGNALAMELFKTPEFQNVFAHDPGSMKDIIDALSPKEFGPFAAGPNETVYGPSVSGGAPKPIAGPGINGQPQADTDTAEVKTIKQLVALASDPSSPYAKAAQAKLDGNKRIVIMHHKNAFGVDTPSLGYIDDTGAVQDLQVPPDVASGKSPLGELGGPGPRTPAAGVDGGVAPNPAFAAAAAAGQTYGFDPALLSRVATLSGQAPGASPDPGSVLDATGKRLQTIQADPAFGGDLQTVLLAASWGPDETKKWLAAGADPSLIPAKDKLFVQKALGGAGIAPADGGSGAPPPAATEYNGVDLTNFPPDQRQEIVNSNKATMFLGNGINAMATDALAGFAGGQGIHGIDDQGVTVARAQIADLKDTLFAVRGNQRLKSVTDAADRLLPKLDNPVSQLFSSPESGLADARVLVESAMKRRAYLLSILHDPNNGGPNAVNSPSSLQKASADEQQLAQLLIKLPSIKQIDTLLDQLEKGQVSAPSAASTVGTAADVVVGALKKIPGIVNAGEKGVVSVEGGVKDITGAPGGAVAQPKTKAEYDALPSGTTYYNPTKKMNLVKP